MTEDKRPKPDDRAGGDRRSGRDRSQGGGRGQGGRRSQGGGRSQGSRQPEERDRVRELAGPLRKVLERLPEVERRVVEMRMGLVDGHPRNLAETAGALGMTNHEAKQVEQRAFDRIREVVPLDNLQKLLEG